jgi:hypothetical protein
VAFQGGASANESLSKILKTGTSPSGADGILSPGEEEITRMLKPVASFLGVPIKEIDPGPNKWIEDKR